MKNASSYKMDGLNQVDRYPDSLKPGYFEVEERDVNDLLTYAVELSKQFNYFTLDDKADGTWEDFFLADANVMIRIFSKFDVNRFIRVYDSLRSRVLEHIEESDEKELLGEFEQLMDFIHQFTVSQLMMRMNLKKVEHAEHFLELTEFKKIVTAFDGYSIDLARFIPFYEDAGKKFGDSISLKLQIDPGLYSKESTGMEEPSFFAGETIIEKISDALSFIDKLFENLGANYYRIAEASRYYLDNHSGKAIFYPPHIGLLLAFLNLYQTLGKHLNRFTQKHLDFYYKEDLGIKRLQQEADKVHLVFSLNPSVREFVIKKGERVLTGLQGQSSPVIFRIDEDITLRHTKVVELKTIYKTEVRKLQAKNKGHADASVTEIKIYCEDNPVAEPADFITKKKRIYSWPVLGEDQKDLVKKSRTMNDANIGLSVASPLFYAIDGKRIFTLQFYISKASFELFEEYVQKYGKAYQANSELAKQFSGINQEVIVFDILARAFNIKITGPAGWIIIDQYRVSLEKDGKNNNYFQVEFELGQKDQPVQEYDPVLHGADFDVQWPMVSIFLNNNAFFHPYTFFQFIKINKVSINVKVEGSTRLQLQNNFGKVTNASPFHLFGPQPEAGSFFDIRNTNIFNRFTKDFSVKISWLDLPKVIGGFETYYDAYDSNIKNDSFKVTLNVLTKDVYQGEETGKVVLDLFKMNEQYLDTQTVFADPAFERYVFDNAPLLSKEEMINTGQFFPDGAIRVELIKPDEAFGHKIYPSVFPAVVMHNSGGLLGGIFRKKWPIPNLPYAPKVKAVTVDYELEYSEELVAQKKGINQHSQVSLFHFHPFGYRQIYPQNHSTQIDFIPPVVNKANLYIGLTELKPGMELNLLFQLDEHNFLPVENEEEPVRWYYLVKDEWIPLKKRAVLIDDTYQFINSGIVKLSIPLDISPGNTILNPSCYWLRASCDAFIRTRVKAVIAQAVTATRVMDPAADTFADFKLEAGLLKEFSRKIPQVLSIQQPFRSFGGRATESDKSYYTRVSGILGHKQRLVTARDIAECILGRFPNEIYKVICYNGYAGQYNYRPGPALQVVLLPFIEHLSFFKIAEPRVKISTIYTIHQYLKDLVSPFFKNQLEVRNPDYETVKVVCSVIFKYDQSGENTGNYIQLLNNDLRKMISPWLFETGMEVMTDGYIYPSEILNFIKKCSYVQYVTGFTMLHFYHCYNTSTGKMEARFVDSSELKLTLLKVYLPGAVFIAAEHNDITTVEKPGYLPAPDTGIQRLVIGSEFVVNAAHKKSEYIENTDDPHGRDNDEIDIYFKTKL